MTVLVIDASVAVAACHTPAGFARFNRYELVAPELMMVEASSVFREQAWREEITNERAADLLTRLLKAPIELSAPSGLIQAAWDIANDLGWAKTYDATYVALARLLGCKLVSLDERLLRRIVRLGIGVRPREV